LLSARATPAAYSAAAAEKNAFEIPSQFVKLHPLRHATLSHAQNMKGERHPRGFGQSDSLFSSLLSGVFRIAEKI